MIDYLPRGKCKFVRGFPKANEMASWLNQHPEILGFAFCGRSNVGKSTLINSLFGKSIARTSNTPGRTREINLFSFQLGEDPKEYYFFDLPGYGHAKVSKQMHKEWGDLMDQFFRNIPAELCVLNIQDSRHPMQKADIQFTYYLENIANLKVLVFNKLDKLKTQKDRSKFQKEKESIFRQAKWAQQIHFVSAEKRQGINELELAMWNYLNPNGE